MDHLQRGLIPSPCFCSIQQKRLDICVVQTDFRGFADNYPSLPHATRNMKSCRCFADPCLYIRLCPSLQVSLLMLLAMLVPYMDDRNLPVPLTQACRSLSQLILAKIEEISSDTRVLNISHCTTLQYNRNI